MLARPEKIRVGEREIECVRVRAMRRGRRVPRSPRAPESSERGCVRRVERLWRVVWRRWVRRVVRAPIVCEERGGCLWLWRCVIRLVGDGR